MDDESLFAEAMGKVKPLAPDNKVVAAKPRPRPSRIKKPLSSPLVAMRAYAASLRPGEDRGVLVADGISRGRLKHLASESPVRTIDLHGFTRNEAMALLESAFAAALHDGVRTMAIIHGRGLHSQGKPVLRDAVYQWLQHGPCAHALLAVTPQAGSGGGVCMVLLRRGVQL